MSRSKPEAEESHYTCYESRCYYFPSEKQALKLGKRGLLLRNNEHTRWPPSEQHAKQEAWG